MKAIFLLLFICASITAFGQNKLNSIDSVADSRKKNILNRIDSLKTTISIDSLKRLSALDSVKSSINAAKEMTENITRVPMKDSLENLLINPINKIKDKIEEKASFLDSLDLGITTPDLKIDIGDNLLLPPLPDVNPSLSPEVDIPGSKEIKDLENKTTKLKQINKPVIPQSDVLKKVNELKGKAGQVEALTGKVDAYSKDINEIKNGNLDKVETLSKDAEKLAVSKVDELKELNKQAANVTQAKNVIQQYQEAMSKMNDEALLDKSKEILKKEFPDYLTHNMEKLKVGAAQLDKLKKKYGNIADSRYLPKRVPNELKEKPLIERFVPGVQLQVQHSNLIKVDVSPFLMYRLHPRWRIGVGGTRRVSFTKKVKFIDENVTYGFRTFANFNAWKGYHLHAEYEMMNTTPFNPLKNFDPAMPKQWIPGAYAGILKRYKINKSVYGNLQMLYNFLYEYNGLYAGKLHVRFAFEFPLHKKKVEAKQGTK